jgi:hypothetical protein
MPEMESRDAGLLLTPKQANPRARPTAARRYFRTNGLFAPRVSTRVRPANCAPRGSGIWIWAATLDIALGVRSRARACGGVRAGPPAPRAPGPAAVGFARVFSTERRRADIKGGHFIARSTR